MNPHHHLEKREGLPVECHVEIRLTVENEPGATVILTALEATPGSRLPEHIESVATRLYQVHLHHLPPERVRWIERCVDNEYGWETAFDIALTWVEAGMFEPAGYRRPHWTALSRRRRPMPADLHDQAKQVPTDSVRA